MLLLISPAKTLDFTPPALEVEGTEPELLGQAEQLVGVMRQHAPSDLSEMMGISEPLAQLNYERFLEWEYPHKANSAKQAVLAFRGDVYQGLAAEDFSPEDFAYAQKHLRILSGLYGVLRPLDLIHPYRLEMGTRLRTDQGSNLYAFWGDTIARILKDAVTDGVLVNLASQEYFKAVRLDDDANLSVYTPVFKDMRNNSYKIISFYAKRARGAMTAWVIQNRISTPEQLRDFRWNGYAFSEALSTPESPTFVRAS